MFWVNYLHVVLLAIGRLPDVQSSDIEDNLLPMGGGDSPLATYSLVRKFVAVIWRRGKSGGVLLEGSPALWKPSPFVQNSPNFWS